jgi:YhcH/YjgK/YiaL family protein
MIVCDSKGWEKEKYAFHPIIDQAIRWIDSTDFTCLEPGKYDLIPNGKMFCLLQEMNTEPVIIRRAESHFDYIDIQYLLAGEENIGVARSHPDNVPGEQHPQHDIVFYTQVINESMITLTPGMFALFFPQDIHRPCCDSHGTSYLRKAVIKIHRSLFERGNVL